MAEIHCLAGLTHHAEREEHERHAIEKVADISVSLAVDEQDSDEEDRPYEVGYVEREARRHYPCGESGADIGTHNHRNGLRQSEQTGIDERYCHNRCCRRRLDCDGEQHTREHT